MTRTEHVCLMAQYNEWMNGKLYDAAMTLPNEALALNRGAFFGSILGTLNHLAVADTTWFKRFATHPANFPALESMHGLPQPTRLDQILHADIQSLAAYRKSLDQTILTWAQSVTEQDLDHVLHYANTKGVVSNRDFFSLLMHVFNHQTHHRGQVTTLLSQLHVDVGPTDLYMLIPDEREA